ncbi:hypothetical protein ZWY2020_024965 [Hordeum vulgare]|nr:hypothetical protein ZWY2020_024965 [Hordeum vulgare]
MSHQAELDRLDRVHSPALADKEAVLERTLTDARVEVHELYQLHGRVFAQTLELADAAMEAHREELCAERVQIGKLTSRTMEEVGIGAQARLNQVVAVMHRL